MASDFEYMEQAAKKMAKQVDRARNAASKKIAKEKAAKRLAEIAYQRQMTGPAAMNMISRVLPAANLAVSLGQINLALRKKYKTGQENLERGKRIAKESEKKSIKVNKGPTVDGVARRGSPTDAMRATSRGREVLAGPKVRVPKPAVKTKVGKPGFNRKTIEKKDEPQSFTPSKNEKKRLRRGSTAYGKRSGGGSIASKPKGVGAATHGFGKAMS